MGIRLVKDSDPHHREPTEASRLAEAAGMTLDAGPGGLELRVPGERRGGGIRGEIESALDRRLDAGHPLRRIISGLAGAGGPIVDATAGLGADAAVAAASSGRRVLACERHPVVAALLLDGRRRAVEAGHEAASRIDVRPGEAIEVLGDGERAAAKVVPAMVLIDPMFPPRRRSTALPPKPMQRLRALLENPDLDVASEVEALLIAADRAGAARIVLKRPPDAATPESPLGSPTFEISTRLLRWSVWQRNP